MTQQLSWSNIVSSTIYNLCEKEKVLKTIFACSYGVKSFKQKQIVNNLLTLSLHCADLSQGSMELPNCKHVPQGGSNLWPPDWDNSVFFTSWDTEVHYLLNPGIVELLSAFICSNLSIFSNCIKIVNHPTLLYLPHISQIFLNNCIFFFFLLYSKLFIL